MKPIINIKTVVDFLKGSISGGLASKIMSYLNPIEYAIFSSYAIRNRLLNDQVYKIFQTRYFMDVFQEAEKGLNPKELFIKTFYEIKERLFSIERSMSISMSDTACGYAKPIEFFTYYLYKSDKKDIVKNFRQHFEDEVLCRPFLIASLRKDKEQAQRFLNYLDENKKICLLVNIVLAGAVEALEMLVSVEGEEIKSWNEGGALIDAFCKGAKAGHYNVMKFFLDLEQKWMFSFELKYIEFALQKAMSRKDFPIMTAILNSKHAEIISEALKANCNKLYPRISLKRKR